MHCLMNRFRAAEGLSKRFMTGRLSKRFIFACLRHSARLVNRSL